MKLQTTFYSDKIETFEQLLYINGRTQEIMFQTDLNNVFQTYLFFKNLAKFVKTKKVRDTIKFDAWSYNDDYFQFATVVENKITPIKWFDLIVSDKNVISHDIAFETTLIKKNKRRLSFGQFPMVYYNRNENVKLPKYRELNIKARAYKYMANQVKELFKK